MNKHRLLLGLFGIALAALFFVNARHYPHGAAEMPLIYSVIVALLSVAMIATELLRSRTAAGASGAATAGEDGAVAVRPRYLAAAGVFALAIAYVALINTLGYVLATVLFMGAALLVIRTVSVRFALIGTASLVAIVCLVFVQFLGLPVPLLPPAIS
ncbi:tripartite tricarboxylate transporter TctB family protein [Stutzerimonas nosocomialis]|uniref:tripartite tricarboxylate transporter TctB family protein n=1 Tax=Stutzerimonas nosocomialis TaxID=1056496 RepID=UPI001107C491|nr:tripartite tricarboxylate transporter TctB family protein [Stutzerimonas nosocomialis]TLX56220.1 tripartite tricarboxylate transporter TctB family protein [Stutzerimonas nosocomialis]TLX58584.1 tripartite tricarboxylate transporter TctB family protein [Stutzerimonas nosocomialis]